MNRKGFSLIEILCVIVILSVLAAILMPVFVKAKMETKASAARMNLKGFWQGLMIYQSDNESKVEYGQPDEMGLPSVHYGWLNFVNDYTGDNSYGWEKKKQFLPCGSQDEGDLHGIGLFYMPGMMDDWRKEVTKREEDTVVMMDKNCNVPGTRLLCQFCEKRSIGVTLGGKIKDRINANWHVTDQKFYQ